MSNSIARIGILSPVTEAGMRNWWSKLKVPDRGWMGGFRSYTPDSGVLRQDVKVDQAYRTCDRDCRVTLRIT
jgi:hypothetical protein